MISNWIYVRKIIISRIGCVVPRPEVILKDVEDKLDCKERRLRAIFGNDNPTFFCRVCCSMGLKSNKLDQNKKYEVVEAEGEKLLLVYLSGIEWVIFST